MGCPGQITIGKRLVFSITTHNSSNGSVENADAEPIYRIYDLNGTQVWPSDSLPGSMSRVDEANTTGFYAGEVVCDDANGFVENTNYTLYIEASVAGDVGAISFEFEVVAVPDYSFNIDTTDLIVAIRDYLANVEVRPTRTIVGACRQPTAEFALPSQKTVKEFVLPKRCP